MGTEYSRLMEGMVDKLEARVKELEHRDICSHCGWPATCMGAYEDERNIGFGCDNCCGHGNEDGWCVPIEEAGEKLIALRIVGIAAEARADKADTKAKAIAEAFWSAIAGLRLEDKEWPMDALNIWNEAKGVRAERDAALAEVERLRAASHGLLTEIVRSRKGSIGGIDTHYIVQLRCGQVDALFAALNPAPELWPCGHEKTHPDEGCRECSP